MDKYIYCSRALRNLYDEYDKDKYFHLGNMKDQNSWYLEIFWEDGMPSTEYEDRIGMSSNGIEIVE